MPEKQISTKTNKGLMIVVVVLVVIISILILSGFKTVNPYLLLAFFLGSSAAVWFFLRKPKEKDFYAMLEEIQVKHYRKMGYFLDITDAYADTLTSELTAFYFPNEGLSFQVINGKVRGIVPRHLYKFTREKEKSRLLENWQKYSGKEAKLNQVADALNVEPDDIRFE